MLLFWSLKSLKNQHWPEKLRMNRKHCITSCRHGGGIFGLVAHHSKINIVEMLETFSDATKAKNISDICNCKLIIMIYFNLF